MEVDTTYGIEGNFSCSTGGMKSRWLHSLCGCIYMFVSCYNVVVGLKFIPFMSAGIFIVKKFALAWIWIPHTSRFWSYSNWSNAGWWDTLEWGYIVHEWFKVEHENSSSGHVMLGLVLMEVYKRVYCNSGWIMKCSSDNSCFHHVTSCVCVCAVQWAHLSLSLNVNKYAYSSGAMYFRVYMYFAPDRTCTIAWQWLTSARPNKMNLLVSASEGWYTHARPCDFLCVLLTLWPHWSLC